MSILVVAAALALAFSNGANDNVKGVATLIGSRTTSYRAALAWATLTTLVGSLAALVFASSLARTFSGSGLVPQVVASSPVFLSAVAMGAAMTVLVATRVGMPVSTTHALTGALAGAGLAAAGAIDAHVLGVRFALPLLVSPVVALVATRVLHPVACALGSEPRRGGAFDIVHVLSAGAISVARGLNDTPKIVGVILAAQVVSPRSAAGVVGVAIAVGGIVGARRVGETLSHRVAEIQPDHGVVANIVTAVLVGAASPMGLPMSTTHVTTGSIIGLGVTNGSARWRAIGTILFAWLTTVPVAALFAALVFRALV